MEIIDISKINKIRKNKGFTIKQLVELSGISYTTLSKICAGYVAKPNTKTLNAIAKALDVPVSIFYKDDDPYNSSINWLSMLPAKTGNAIIKFFALNESSQKLVDALFSESPDELSIAEINNRIPLFESLLQVKDVDTVKNLSTTIDIILKNPAVIDVVVACADQSTDDLKKIASAIPCLYPEKSNESK